MLMVFTSENGTQGLKLTGTCRTKDSTLILSSILKQALFMEETATIVELGWTKWERAIRQATKGYLRLPGVERL